MCRTPSIRTILCLALMGPLAVFGGLAGARGAEKELAYRTELSTILTGPRESLYFQSRGAVIPDSPQRIIVTTQLTDRFGSHGYRDVFQIESTDGGKSWSSPTPIETLRRTKLENGDEVVAGDLCPQWHAATKVVLSTGKTFTFRGGTKEDRGAEQVSYCVYSPKSGAWGKLQIVEMPATDHAGKAILAPNAGCHQRVDLPSGDILLPIRYTAEKLKQPYTTIVALCRFDGEKLTYVKHGSEFSIPVGRGLYEPSVTRFGERYFLTMRGDQSAFVARSQDGLDYEPFVEWKYDDGAVLGSYNTQQHWVSHGNGLYLCYTRRGANNDHVFRHRAPLFIAKIDPERLCVLRATEQILIPENHAALGNFGVVDISPTETWIIESEHLVSGKRQHEPNKVFAAKLYWRE